MILQFNVFSLQKIRIFIATKHKITFADVYKVTKKPHTLSNRKQNINHVSSFPKHLQIWKTKGSSKQLSKRKKSPRNQETKKKEKKNAHEKQIYGIKEEPARDILPPPNCEKHAISPLEHQPPKVSAIAAKIETPN